MFKKTVLSSLLVLSFNSFAGELSDAAEDIEILSQKISQVAENIEYGSASQRAKRKLRNQLKQLIKTAGDMKAMLGGQGGNGGGPDPRPLPSRAMYSAKCHIDDDPSLDFDQTVVDVQGANVSQVIQDCKLMAQAMYPGQEHSSGIKKLKLESSIPYGMQSGLCHIDDDVDFDFDQTVQGTIYGYSLAQIISDCSQLASSAFGSEGTSGIKKINANVSVPSGKVSGTCHIDDDPDMDFNQFVPGIVFGNSIQSISQDCRDLATSTFGMESASGLKNIKR